MMKVLVTGGAGFIGSHFVRYVLRQADCSVMVLDKLTYAGRLETMADFYHHPRFCFERLDISDLGRVRQVMAEFAPQAVVHLAAESHVDRSIDGPAEFLQTNVMGTFSLLQAAREYYQQLSVPDRQQFRWLQVSTDEVYGSLEKGDAPYTETSRYAPRNPYSASKAAADHLVRAWQETYALPAMVSASSNNYGPFQFPEKFVPVVILRALNCEPIPIYGTGEQIRDWLCVTDHVRGLWQILQSGRVGETYHLGGQSEISNLDLAALLCQLLDEGVPPPRGLRSYAELIRHVADRPGHDFRYAMNGAKAAAELGWQPVTHLVDGLRATVAWYAQRRDWWEPLLAGLAQRDWN